MNSLQSLESLGVTSAVLTGTDGLVIECVARGSLSPELLAAEMANMLRSSRNLTQGLGGEVKRFTLLTDEREILAVTFSEYVLGAIVEKGGDRKAIGTELSRLASKLAHTY